MTWMDFKIADTSERRVFCNTILLKYHVCHYSFFAIVISTYKLVIRRFFHCKNNIEEKYLQDDIQGFHGCGTSNTNHY